MSHRKVDDRSGSYRYKKEQRRSRSRSPQASNVIVFKGSSGATLKKYEPE